MREQRLRGITEAQRNFTKIPTQSLLTTSKKTVLTQKARLNTTQQQTQNQKLSFDPSPSYYRLQAPHGHHCNTARIPLVVELYSDTGLLQSAGHEKVSHWLPQLRRGWQALIGRAQRHITQAKTGQPRKEDGTKGKPKCIFFVKDQELNEIFIRPLVYCHR